MKKVGIIIPSYEEPRVLNAIRSVIDLDPDCQTQIIVVDGSPSVTKGLKGALRKDDILINEPDEGIFDALNKGLEAIDTCFIGWMGADDTWLMSMSDIVADLNDATVNMLSYTTLFHNAAGKIVRVYPPVKNRYARILGFHLPHFSTFVRKTALTGMKFNIENSPVSDIDFFIKVEKRLSTQTVKIIDRPALSMRIGGTSNANSKAILRNNLKVYGVLGHEYNYLYATIFLINKIFFKIFQMILASFVIYK
jgi:glycosyltransferase